MQLTSKQRGSVEIVVILGILVVVLGVFAAYYRMSSKLAECSEKVVVRDIQINRLQAEARTLTQTIETQNQRLQDLLEASKAKSDAANKKLQELRKQIVKSQSDYQALRKKWRSGEPRLRAPEPAPAVLPDTEAAHVAVVCSQVGDMLRQYHKFRKQP